MSIHDRLRAATRDAHKRVDRRFSGYDLGDPLDYRCFLEAHRAVLPGCERTLEASGAGLLIDDWGRRARTLGLLADLDSLGGAPARAIPAGRWLAPAAAFGMLYVIEGSRLGSAILARRVLDGGSARCAGATRYLRHGEGLRLWPSFLAALESSVAVHDDPDAVVASAIETFALFEHAPGPLRTAA